MRALVVPVPVILWCAVGCATTSATPAATSARVAVREDAELAAIADHGVALVAGHLALAHGRPVPAETLAALPSWSDLPKLPELSTTIAVWDAPLRAEQRRDRAGRLIDDTPLSFVDPMKRYAWQQRGAPIAGACARRVGSTVAVDVVLDGIDAVAVFERVVRGPSGRWIFGHPRFRATGSAPPCEGAMRHASTLHVEENVLGSAPPTTDVVAEPIELARASLAALAVLRSGDDDAIVALVSPMRAPRDYDEWRATNRNIVAALQTTREAFVHLRPAFIVASPEDHAATIFGASAEGLVATSISIWFSRVDGQLHQITQTEATEMLARLGEDEHRGHARPTYAIDDDGVALQPSMAFALAAVDREAAARLGAGVGALPCRDARMQAMLAVMDVYQRARVSQLAGTAFASLRDLGFAEPLTAGPYAITLEGAGVNAVIVATGSGVAAGDVIRVSRDAPVPSFENACAGVPR